MDNQEPLLNTDSSDEHTGGTGFQIKKINITDEMKTSYIDYAMSVIVGRALPDVRDGLKPVHRRILFAMYEGGYTAGRAYKKSARIVGDVLGRYHPHGDSAVYDSLVRMAQEFSMRYPLIDGQGNYGSVDGDNAAAMRYTEARMQRLSMAFLEDIEKETVNFVPNFDESLQEPTVLPTKLPNLLLNGSSGIAVGMATNIPPHNLRELSAGVSSLVDNPDVTIDELMRDITAPDFPTGGIICGLDGVRLAYHTGRGSVVVRAKTTIEETKRGRTAIIVHEIPFMVNKANLIVKIAELVQDKKINGISDLRDESDRKGMRIYIELKRDASAPVILNQLFKHTQLQSTFGVNMVALVDGVPRMLNLKQVLENYVKHRKEVITRRTQYDLRKAKERLHILEGLRIALQHIDAIIALIKSSANTDEARAGLVSTFNLSEIQANAILEMRLQRLTGLERDKIETEYAQILETIKDLEDILANESRVRQIIKDETQALNDKYGDNRRSEIGPSVGTMDIEDLIPNEQVAILLSKKGFVKRMSVTNFRSQARGGRGVNSMTTRDEDFIEHLHITNTHDYVLMFTSTGRTFKIKSYTIPEASKQSKGTSISHFLNLEENEIFTAMIPVKRFDTDEYLFMTTQNGIVKKTPLNAFIHFKNRPIIAINLDANDKLNWVRKTDGKSDVILTTSAGMVIRFNESQVRAMGRASRGVKGIKIKPEDCLISMGVIDPQDDQSRLLILTSKGYGKNVKVDQFKVQSRGGIGVKCLKFRKTVKDDFVTDSVVANPENEVMIVTQNGTLTRQEIGKISTQKRESQGVRIMKIDDDDLVVAISQIASEEEAERNAQKEEAFAATAPSVLSTSSSTDDDDDDRDDDLDDPNLDDPNSEDVEDSDPNMDEDQHASDDLEEEEEEEEEEDDRSDWFGEQQRLI